MSSKILFIHKNPITAQHLVQESLDLVLAFSAFERPVAVLFLGAGLDNLREFSYYKILSEYEINDCYVLDFELEAAGLKPAELVIPVKIISAPDLVQLLSASASILQI